MGIEIHLCMSDSLFSTCFFSWKLNFFYLHLPALHAEIPSWATLCSSWIWSPEATLRIVYCSFLYAAIRFLSFTAWLVRSWEGQRYKTTGISTSQALLQLLIWSVKTWGVSICRVLLQFNKASWNSYFKLIWLSCMSLNIKTPDNPSNLNLSKISSKRLPILFKSDGVHLCAI